MTKNLLFTLTHAPYGSALAYEATEALLLAASYPFELSVLFMNDGILQLLPEQYSKLIHQKNIAKMLTALPEFDLTRLFITAADLQRYSLSLQQLILPVNILNAGELSNLIKSQQMIMNF